MQSLTAVYPPASIHARADHFAAMFHVKPPSTPLRPGRDAFVSGPDDDLGRGTPLRRGAPQPRGSVLISPCPALVDVRPPARTFRSTSSAP